MVVLLNIFPEEKRAALRNSLQALAFRIGEITPETWRDVEIADKMARRAAGLDAESAISNTNAFQLHLLGERIGLIDAVYLTAEEWPE